MIVSLIVAYANAWVIGKDNQLLWHLPADLKHFKQLTTGHPVIMGRKTFESIGKPLPNRVNVVVSRQQNLNIEGVTVVHSLEEALKTVESCDECFVIGGGELYRQSLHLTDKLYLTQVHANFDGDTYFPEINFAEWKLIEKNDFQEDEKNKYSYSFVNYLKNR